MEVTDKTGETANAGDMRFIEPGCRALVVDDVAFNLVVVKGLLAAWQLDIDTCQSGREALDLLKTKSFDLVFMDHMMPDMDGIETTRRLRGLSEKLKTIPVIALTADATGETRELFLQNGFDDFLSKPINIERLHEIMRKWAPGKKKRSPVAAKPENELSGETSIAISGLDSGRGIVNIGGSEAAYIEALSIYCLDADAHLPILAAPPPPEKITSFITQVHGLKSASANVGARAIAETAAILEEAGRRGDMAVIRARLDGFCAEISGMSGKIRAFLAERSLSNANAAATFDPDELQKMLNQLAEALTTWNIGAIDRLIDAIIAGNLDGQSLETMRQVSIKVLLAEFDEALALVNKLSESL
jgi:CheY-like chemotaxis protein